MLKVITFKCWWATALHSAVGTDAIFAIEFTRLLKYMFRSFGVYAKPSQTFNLRPAGGLLKTPFRFFSRLSKKRRRCAPPFLAHLIIHPFRTCCENFRPRSRKVRSPCHVKWPHLIKSLNVPQRYTDQTIALKLSAIDTSNSVYKMHIPAFLHQWLRSGQFVTSP